MTAPRYRPAPPNLVGLRRFPLRELTPEACAAVDSLHARGWFRHEEVICTCGTPFTSTATAACWTCVKGCSHRPLRGYIVQIDGRCAAAQYCGYCGLKLASLTANTWIYDVCFKDNRLINPPQPTEPCERCGSATQTQYHHWGPRAIFLDTDSWPTAWLCQTCHTAWHNAMRAAGGVSLPEDQRSFTPNATADNTDPWAWAHIGRAAA